MDDTAEKLRSIADASRRNDGSDIPLGEQCREAANEIDKLRSALRFYADPSKYEPVSGTTLLIGFIHGEIHDRDRGERARAALEDTER